MPETSGLTFVPGDKNKPRIPHYPVAGPVGTGMVTDQNKSRDGSINELAASIASKLVRNAPIDPEPSDPPKGDGLICQSERENDKIPRHRKQLRLSCTISRHTGRRVRTNIEKGPTRA